MEADDYRGRTRRGRRPTAAPSGARSSTARATVFLERRLRRRQHERHRARRRRFQRHALRLFRLQGAAVRGADPRGPAAAGRAAVVFPPSAGDPRELLREFGRRLIEMMTRPETVAQVRIVIAATGEISRASVGRFTRRAPAMAYKGWPRNCSTPSPRRARSRSPTPSWRRASSSTCASPDCLKRVLFGVVETRAAEEIERRRRRRGRGLSASAPMARDRPPRLKRRPPAPLVLHSPPSRRYRRRLDRRFPRSHRLAVQDVALSRRKLGFDSPWERQSFFAGGDSRGASGSYFVPAARRRLTARDISRGAHAGSVMKSRRWDGLWISRNFAGSAALALAISCARPGGTRFTPCGPQ